MRLSTLLRSGLLLAVLLSLASASFAQSRGEKKASLKTCIDRQLKLDEAKSASVEQVLLTCRVEYDSFIGSLDSWRSATFRRLIHGYIAHHLNPQSQ